MIVSRRVGFLFTSVVLASPAGCAAAGSASSGESAETVASTRSASASLSRNTTTRESFDGQGRQGNGPSTTPSISPNQRYVAFQSESSAWAPVVDTNGRSDVYLKDRQTGSITLVSAAGQVVGNAGSFSPSVSDDGTVVFVTDATNLASGASGPSAKVLLRSPSGALSRVDVALSGEADGASANPQISGDGTTVVFQSSASNLVSADTNETTDIFVAKRSAGAVVAASLTRVSLTQAGAQTNGASFDATVDYVGGVVAFASDASNVLFNDGNEATDVFAVDLTSDAVFPVSFATTGFGGSVGDAASSSPQISGDGRAVVFRSLATNFTSPAPNGLATIYVNPIQSGRSPVAVSLTSSGALANGASYQSAISFDGTVVAFVSVATNLGGGSDAQAGAGVFARDQTTGETIRIDAAVSGGPPDGSALINSSLRFSGSPTVPAPSFLVFDSVADDLTYGDTNGVADVFSASLSL
jgi:hypothetical protein